MSQTLTLLVLLLGAGLAALLAWLGMAGAAQFTARRQHGYLHWIFYALLFLLGLGSLLSGRNLTSNYLMEELIGMGSSASKPPLLATLQPAASILVLALSGERLLTHWLLHRRRHSDAGGSQPLMLLAFVLFWLGSTASPALLGAHPKVSHDYLYPLVIGLAAALASPREHDLALKAIRNGLLLLMLAGVLLVPFKPTLVMDTHYSQGLIPGLPRFAGLASHAVSMGLLTQIGLLCLMARPFERRWMQRAAWALGLGVLLMAQSKTAWLAFVLTGGAMLVWQHGTQLRQRLGDPLRPDIAMVVVLLCMAGVAAFVLLAMFGDVGGRIARFWSTPEGAQLASLTGRDRIWAIAWEEWSQHPVFGYGPQLWGEAYRQAIGMRSATHAHNQFMDTLSRAGTVGATALLLYAALLLVLSLRFARVTRGLSVALFLALLLRAMSEVPLLLFGYGPELITHVLLLMTLSAAHARTRASAMRVPVKVHRSHASPKPRPLARGLDSHLRHP